MFMGGLGVPLGLAAMRTLAALHRRLADLCEPNEPPESSSDLVGIISSLMNELRRSCVKKASGLITELFQATATNMGKTLRRALTSSSECIRVGGFSSTTLRFNPCGWSSHAKANLQKASARRCRPDGAVKNKGTRREPARSYKKSQLTSSGPTSDWSFEESVDCRHYTSYFFQTSQRKCVSLRRDERMFTHSTASESTPQEPSIHLEPRDRSNKPKFLQQPGKTFEEKLVNGVARDVSQLCMKQILTCIAGLKCEGLQTVEIQVPLCLDFNMKELECVSLQLVTSRTNMDQANTRPWYMTAT
jgi:hypothetical protein